MTAIVEVRDLTKRYDGEKLALKNLSFKIAKGEIIALLGPNGAGKTSLISAICGLTTISQGKVFVSLGVPKI